MDTLVIVRHGDYANTSGDLTQPGIKEVTDLAEKLIPYVEGKKVRLVSSKTPQATQSAAIIANRIGVQVETDQMLTTKHRFDLDLPGTLRLVRHFSPVCEVLIFVAHVMQARDFVEYYAQCALGISGRTGWFINKVKTGTAVVIDCNEKSYIHL